MSDLGLFISRQPVQGTADHEFGCANFIRIWTCAHQCAPERGSARGWIYAIVRNRALNMLRDGKREDLVAEDRLETLQETDQLEQIMATWHRLDRNSRLRDCLGALDETKRQGILLAYVGGYSHDEIAGRLRIPLGTAKSWIRSRVSRESTRTFSIVGRIRSRNARKASGRSS